MPDLSPSVTTTHTQIKKKEVNKFEQVSSDATRCH